MSKNLTEKEWFRYWFPAYVAGCSVITFFPLTFSSSDLPVILYVFTALPVVNFVLLFVAQQRKGTQRLAVLRCSPCSWCVHSISMEGLLKNTNRRSVGYSLERLQG